MPFLNRQSIPGKLLMGLACVAVLTAMVAAARPFEPAATIAAQPNGGAVANAAP